MIDTIMPTYTSGAVVHQSEKNSNSNERETVGYWNRALNQAEQNNSERKHECLAVIWAIQSRQP